MSGIWVVAFVVQWLVLAGGVVVVLALVRQVAALSQEPEAGPVEINVGDGPSVGRALDEVAVPLLDGDVHVLGAVRLRPALVVFLSAGCLTCRDVPAHLQEVVALDPHVDVLMVVKGSDEAAREMLGRADLPGVALTKLDWFPEHHRPTGGYPFAFSVTPGDVPAVAARAVPNNPDALTALIHAAREHASPTRTRFALQTSTTPGGAAA